MPKGKNMDCVHKCVYNRSLEFEKNKQQQTIKMKKHKTHKKTKTPHTHTHTHTHTGQEHTTHYLLKMYIIIVHKIDMYLYTIYHVNNR